MRTQKITKVLKKLTVLFNKNKINWVLGGSTNLFLQGIDIVPGDVDILTTRGGALKAGELLKTWEVKKVKYRKSKDFVSYWGVYKINGIQVEILGEPKKKYLDGSWSKKSPLSRKVFKQLASLKVPLLSLQLEYEYYQNTGEEKKAGLIKKLNRGYPEGLHMDQAKD